MQNLIGVINDVLYFVSANRTVLKPGCFGDIFQNWYLRGRMQDVTHFCYEDARCLEKGNQM